MPFHLTVGPCVGLRLFFLSIAKPTQTIYQISYNEHQLIPVQPGHDPLEIRINKH